MGSVWNADWSNALIDFATHNSIQSSSEEQIATLLSLHTVENLIPRPLVPLQFRGDWYASSCDNRGSIAPHRFDKNKVSTEAGYCVFRTFEASGNKWTASADCHVGNNSWSSKIVLEHFGQRIRWTSDKGSAIYIKCN
jgi:hypothetical protein